VPDKAHAHSRRTRPDAPEAPEVVELRTRLAAQAEAIEGMRRELSWLTDELVAQDSEVEGLTDAFAPRLVPSRTFHRMRRLVHEHVSYGGRLVVVSSGDDALLRYAGYTAEHLSRDHSGAWTGSHPGCGRTAVVQLEAARWRGADVLLVPDFQGWWFDHYPEFALHLARRYARITGEPEVGELWDLRKPAPAREIHDLLARVSARLVRQPVVLDWHTGFDLTAALDDYKVITPIGELPELPYLDGSIDVVAIGEAREDQVAEARRVASAAVLSIETADPPTFEIIWQSDLSVGSTKIVSIVVASGTGGPSTSGYVHSLLDTLPASFTGEILVDLDCDEMAQQLGPDTARRRRRIKTFQCPEGEPYHARIRRGAEASSGDLLVALDGATWPLPGWLPSLEETMGDPRIGLATGMFARTDGRLVDCPSDDHLDAPRHNYVRRLEAARPELFVVRRDLFLGWAKVGRRNRGTGSGLSDYIKANDLEVRYQPETVAILSRAGAEPTESPDA
jgi:hypothetical protein